MQNEQIDRENLLELAQQICPEGMDISKATNEELMELVAPYLP